MGNAYLDNGVDTAPYWYEGRCPHTGQTVRLPRTTEVEAIARDLMADLQSDPHHHREGKMYGVLLAQAPSGETVVLKAFSGLLNGQGTVPGWVPPIPGRAQVALQETRTLASLAAIKTELLTLKALPARAELARLTQHYRQHLADLATVHRQRKGDRHQQRQILSMELSGSALASALAELDGQSQRDGMERRRLKLERDAAIAPLQTQVADADQRIQALKRQRKEISRQLQQQMHAVYRLTNFAGESLPLSALAATGLPTGTGDCAAPKLLHAAAVHGLRPLALAEFWWGPSEGGKKPEQFYGACRDRCQPILGFLLSGLSDPWPCADALGAVGAMGTGGENGLPLEDAGTKAVADHRKSSSGGRYAALTAPYGRYALAGKAPALDPLPILYEDEALLVVDKPAGLLSVPGRTGANQDSVLSRLRCQHPDGDCLLAVHRLDQATSGVLLLAKSLATLRLLQAQFQTRQIQKRYLACLTQAPPAPRGTIALPLWANPTTRPRQQVCHQRGKPCLTHYRVLADRGNGAQVEFQPVTGRTHQLRVHAAHPDGLNAPIVGDRLYGRDGSELDRFQNLSDRERLHLHATAMQVTHPTTGQPLTLTSPPPF
jgi:tRNA pseudouridine32 synthase/23S rRNA pseudouridine746 synthase